MADASIDNIIPDIDYMIYRKCDTTWEIIRNQNLFWDITYLVKGRATYTLNGVPHDVKEGDLLCIPSGTVREANTYTDCLMNCYSVNCFVTDLAGAPAQLPFPLISHIGWHDDLVQLLSELSSVWTSKPMGHIAKARGICLLIIHKLYEILIAKTGSAIMDPRVKRAIKYISENYAENISVNQLAGLAGLNPVYFGALFKQETGIHVNRYITQVRVNHAENMLRSGECGIGEAAARCGYVDLSHFHKRFKGIKGYSPSACVGKEL